MIPKQLNNTEHPNSWIRVTLYSFQHYWINTQSGALFNERSSRFPQGHIGKSGHLYYCLSDKPVINKCICAHQLVYYSFHGRTELPKDWINEQIDHIDKNPQHNWISNLRLGTQRQNMQNLHTNLPPGVVKRGSKYQALIVFEGIQYNLGIFDTLEEASKAYQKAEKRINENTFSPANIVTPHMEKADSCYRGVCRTSRGKWRATIKNKHLGVFATEELAYEARLEAERRVA